MRIEHKREFVKQLARLPVDDRLRIARFAYETLPSLNQLGDDGRIERMQGHADCYKVRFGDYRLGLVLDGDIVTVRMVRHRREMYRYFP